jgi:hypothetical protein
MLLLIILLLLLLAGGGATTAMAAGEMAVRLVWDRGLSYLLILIFCLAGLILIR